MILIYVDEQIINESLNAILPCLGGLRVLRVRLRFPASHPESEPELEPEGDAEDGVEDEVEDEAYCTPDESFSDEDEVGFAFERGHTHT